MSELITKEIIVKGRIQDIYKLWTDFEIFPQFMKNIKSVRKTSSKTSHWVMEGPFGKDLEWDAQITEQIENKSIAWNSFKGDIKVSGQVAFNALSEYQTQVILALHYVPPAGKLGEVGAHLFDNPDKKVLEDLRKFKEYAENFSEAKSVAF